MFGLGLLVCSGLLVGIVWCCGDSVACSKVSLRVGCLMWVLPVGVVFRRIVGLFCCFPGVDCAFTVCLGCDMGLDFLVCCVGWLLLCLDSG